MIFIHLQSDKNVIEWYLLVEKDWSTDWKHVDLKTFLPITSFYASVVDCQLGPSLYQKLSVLSSYVGIEVNPDFMIHMGIGQACLAKIPRYWSSSFFGCVLDPNDVSVYKYTKKKSKANIHSS